MYQGLENNERRSLNTSLQQAKLLVCSRRSRTVNITPLKLILTMESKRREKSTENVDKSEKKQNNNNNCYII